VSARPTVLLVDDDADIRRLVTTLLDELADVVCVSTLGAARAALLEQPDVVLLDLHLEGDPGDPLVVEAARATPHSVVFVMSGSSDLERGMALLREGAEDYFTKPIDPLTLRRRVERALVRRSLSDRLQRLESAPAADPAAADPALATLALGASAPMRELVANIRTLGPSGMTVLILGETGAGKELVARAVHGASSRASGPFVTVNCGALPRELMEAELFGHTAGAFTGASAARKGLVGAADGGTLFLDEVGELPLPLQPKLLRFLQDGEVRRVGADTARASDVRVVAATHQDLAGRVASGEFREDLYFRLSVLPLRVPALRDRRSDIPGLAEQFLLRAARESGRALRGFEKSALRALISRPWPGNVRELENCVRRAVVFSEGPLVTAGDLQIEGASGPEIAWPERLLEAPVGEARAEVVAAFEAAYVEAALRAAGGNVAEAARRAGVPRKSFWRIAKRVGLAADRAARKEGRLSTDEPSPQSEIEALLRTERVGYVVRTRETLAAAGDLLEGSMGLKEWGEIKAIAHRIAGSGGSFGLPDLTRHGRALEASADALDAPACREQLRLLGTSLDAAQGGAPLRH